MFLGCYGCKHFAVYLQLLCQLLAPTNFRVARSRIWCCRPGRRWFATPWRNKLFCHGQYRADSYAGGPGYLNQEDRQSNLSACPLCDRVEG